MTNNASKVDHPSFCDICRKIYKEQAIWFLNLSNVGNVPNQFETIWKMHKKCSEYDKRQENGCSLEPIYAHRVLEYVGGACSKKELRSYLTKIRPSFDNSNKISLVEILIYHFDLDYKELIQEQSSSNSEKLRHMRNKLSEANLKLQNAIDAEREALKESEVAQQAENGAKREEEELSKAIKASKIAENKYMEAKLKSENELTRVQSEQNQLGNKMKELECKAMDHEIGIVKRNKAKAELSMLKNTDPLPLRALSLQREESIRKLKILTETTRKSAIIIISKKELAFKAKVSGEMAKNKAVEKARIAENLIPATKALLKEIKYSLEELLKTKSANKGELLYIDREMKEIEKYLPKCKLQKVKQDAEIYKKKLSSQI